MTDNNLCNSCTNIGCEFQSGIVRTKCAFYMPPHIEPNSCGNYVVMLKELQYDLYHALCHEIHGKEDCPCTNQTTSCLATFRVCDADRAIDKVIQQKINALRGEKDGKRIC